MPTINNDFVPPKHYKDADTRGGEAYPGKQWISNHKRYDYQDTIKEVEERGTPHPDMPKSARLRPKVPRPGNHGTYTSPLVIAATLRGIRAMEMRQSGEDLIVIARELGFGSTAAVSHCIKDTMEKLLVEVSEGVRDIELTRLDRLLKSVWTAATTPDHKDQFKAIDRVLAIMRQRAELLGLHEVKQIDMTVWIREQAKERNLDEFEIMNEVNAILAQVE